MKYTLTKLQRCVTLFRTTDLDRAKRAERVLDAWRAEALLGPFLEERANLEVLRRFVTFCGEMEARRWSDRALREHAYRALASGAWSVWMHAPNERDGVSGGASGSSGAVGVATRNALEEAQNALFEGATVEAVTVPKEPLTWVEVVLLDEADQPFPHEAYSIELPDGRVVEGTLDAKGSVYVDQIPAGQCKVRFPRLDQEAWVPTNPPARA